MYTIPIIIIIVVIIILIYYDYEYYSINKSKFLVDIKDVQFRTGDLVFTRYDHSILNFNSQTCTSNINIKNIINSTKIFSLLFIHNIYTHMGVIIIINNMPHVYEISNISNVKRPRLIPIDDYVREYTGHVYHMSYIGDSLNTNISYNFINSNNHKHIFSITPTFIYNYLNSFNKNNTINQYYWITCCSLVAYFLKAHGIFHKNCFRATPTTFLKYVCPHFYRDVKLLKNKYSIQHQ